MRTLVLDASVAVAWHLPKEFSAPARGWQQQLLAGEVAFANVLRTYVRRGELPEPLAHEIHAAHLEAPLVRSDPDPEAILACALEYETTTYDAVYQRLALQRDVELLTAERTTTPWVRNLADRVVAVR